MTLVRGMLEKATEEKELLVGLGMTEDLPTDLAHALVDFEQTLAATHAGRRDHVGAGADLAAVASEISRQVRLLEGLVRYRFSDKPELMAAWASARNVLGAVAIAWRAANGSWYEGECSSANSVIELPVLWANEHGARLDSPCLHLVWAPHRLRIIEYKSPQRPKEIKHRFSNPIPLGECLPDPRREVRGVISTCICSLDLHQKLEFITIQQSFDSSFWRRR
jgi:hypothetical protein